MIIKLEAKESEEVLRQYVFANYREVLGIKDISELAIQRDYGSFVFSVRQVVPDKQAEAKTDETVED